jgi:predicted PurR-regulated permease PerM
VTDPVETPRASTAQKTARYVLIVALVLVGAWMLRRFLPALAWAVVLAIATAALFNRWSARFSGKHRQLWAALTFTMLVGIVLVGPLVYGGIIAVREAISLLRHYAESAQQGPPPLPDWLLQLPWVSDWIQEMWRENLGQNREATNLLIQPKHEVFEWTRVLGLQVMRRITTLGFTLLTLFFIYLNGQELTRSVQRAARRMFGPSVEPLLVHMVGAIRATVDGVVLVAVAEGALMGAVYAIVGVPHPALFGVLTGVFAMIPFAAPIAFGVVAVILFSQGAVASAVTVLVIGLIILFIADHFVRPVIIGGGARVPFLWVLLGILGGIESFGLIGIFLGPALMAALSSLWRTWSAEHPSAETM